MTYRLGLDLGTNSIGWAIYELRDGEIFKLIDAGVRIFSDGRNPKDGSSLAVQRREPRSHRRNLDRKLLRHNNFMHGLIKYHLMPQDKADRKTLETLNPYALRIQALDEKIDLYYFGRALFHLQQRRGFKSNRKTDKAGDDSGKIKTGIRQLKTMMDEKGYRTIGEALGTANLADPHISTRAKLEGVGAKSFYPFYAERSLIEDEFDILWAKQQEFHGKDILSNEAYEYLRHYCLSFQRPLKKTDVGKCTFIADEPRAALALPSVQYFRIYQEVNNLRFINDDFSQTELTLEQRDLIVEALSKAAKKTFGQIRKILKISSATKFNLESEKRDHLKGHISNVSLNKAWGEAWYDLTLQQQDEIVLKLLEIEQETKILQWLLDEYQLEGKAAENVMNAKLADGYGRVSKKAIDCILPYLQVELITYDKAAEAAGFDHADAPTGEIFARLPYYGEVLERHVAFGTTATEDKDDPEKYYGKIANPTVHVVLNQVRKLVNEIMERYDFPEEIIIEVGRDLKTSQKQKQEIQQTQAKNQKANEARSKDIENQGLIVTGHKIIKLRLWEELNPSDPLVRKCIYTGTQISLQMALSDATDVDHILPFSRTLDNSMANKLLCISAANRQKTNKTPFEAFAHRSDYNWDEIQARAHKLPKNKAWRFAENAMDRYDEEEKGFLDRHLTDMQYITTITAKYLQKCCDPHKIWTSPGRLTALIRRSWGLSNLLSDHNKKNRADHRHHAIDAMVIAATDRGILNKISKHAGREEDEQVNRLLKQLDLPYETYRDEARDMLNKMIISHKADKGRSYKYGKPVGGGTTGALHNDTAYGLTGKTDKSGKPIVVHRVPLASLVNAQKLEAIRDEVLRNYFLDKTQGLTGKGFTEALLKASDEVNDDRRRVAKAPVRSVRIVENLNVICIQDRKTGRVYKAFKGDGNHCFEIFINDKGKWASDTISRFDANQKDYHQSKKLSSHGHPLMMRLFKDDFIAIHHGDERRILRVVKFSGSNIWLADHNEAGALKSRDTDKDDEFKYFTKSGSSLRAFKPRKVIITPIGRVLDGGYKGD